MNGSFYSYPSLEYSRVINKTIFDASGAYVIPPETSFLYIFAVAGGGGGGGGSRQPSGSNSTGGAGGSGGTFYHDLLFAPSIGAETTLYISLGAGGTAGTAGASDGSNGGNGGNGGDTTISVYGKVGYLAKVLGGRGGAGGTTSGSSTGGVGYTSVSMKLRSTKVYGGGTGGSTTPIDIYMQQHQDSAGSGGGGVSGSTASTSGAIRYGGYPTMPAVVNPNLNLKLETAYDYLATIAYPAAGVGAAGRDSAFHIFDSFSPGLGGVGGGGGATVAAGRGGNGYRGSGGGGGGGSRNGFAAGAGGVGGNGYCVIMALT